MVGGCWLFICARVGPTLPRRYPDSFLIQTL